MPDDQKLPPPNPVTKSLTYGIDGLQFSQDTNNDEKMCSSGVTPQLAIKKLEEAIKKGAFEGIGQNDK